MPHVQCLWERLFLLSDTGCITAPLHPKVERLQMRIQWLLAVLTVFVSPALLTDAAAAAIQCWSRLSVTGIVFFCALAM